jgi:hypothetical protein
MRKGNFFRRTVMQKNKLFLMGMSALMLAFGLITMGCPQEADPPTYIVTFDANGGTPTPEPQSVEGGGKATEPTAPTKDGTAFEGWYYGDAAWDFNTVVPKSITLVARWATAALAAPELQGGSPAVSYADDGKVSVTFIFDTGVTAAAAESANWDIAADEAKTTITATPKDLVTAGTLLTLTLTAANISDNSLTTAVEPVKVRTVSGKFARPQSVTNYQVRDYDDNGAVRLTSDADTQWYYVADAGLKNIFRSIYAPNAPESEDNVEMGKTAIRYTGDISTAALNLFFIKLGASAADDAIEIKGTTLPTAGGINNTNLIVIDIGIPDVANNLPTFSIPNHGLGAGTDQDGTATYPGIRLRVNKGASLVIEADNSAYLAEGAGHSAPNGAFNNGCVEVMAGGKLRDGAFEGFPLGKNAVILNRNNSSLAVGPADTTGVSGDITKWYAGDLIGPQGSGARIQWDTGDLTGDYIEVRPTELAIAANVTVKKTLGLIYSVFFVDGAHVTIDAASDSLTINGLKGLFANGVAYKFYGNKEQAGGQITASPAARITVNSGSTLHKLFLTANGNDANNFITAADEAIVITNKGNEGGVSAVTYSTDTGISGYLNWDIPEAQEE